MLILIMKNFRNLADLRILFFIITLVVIVEGQNSTRSPESFTEDNLETTTETSEPVTTEAYNGTLNRSSEIPQTTEYHFPLPPGYNKFVLPTGKGGSIPPIKVSILIRSVLGVDEKNEEVTLDADIGFRWSDMTIYNFLVELGRNSNFTLEDKILDTQILNDTWKPDIFIDQMSSFEISSLLGKLATLKFFATKDLNDTYDARGDFLFFGRTTLKLKCEMNFHYYPADTQECRFDLRSYAYQSSDVELLWEETTISPDFKTRGVFLNDPEEPNFNIQVESVLPENGTELVIEETFNADRRGNYSALEFTLKVRRKLSYHLIQTYLPSVLLILITWLCFLLPTDMVEARIGISMTTVLTCTAMFSSVRERSPTVSYTMAIDIWMVFCIFNVFIALSLFTSIYWAKKRLEILILRVSTNKAIVETTDEEPLSDKVIHEAQTTYKRVLEFNKKYAFLAFSFSFTAFFCLYWVWLLYYSEYFKWTVNPAFNALDEDAQLYRRKKIILEREL